MSHMQWVARQNKLEIPRDKDEVNKREIREYDGRTHDPDTMVVPPTPKPTFKGEVLVLRPPSAGNARAKPSQCTSRVSHESRVASHGHGRLLASHASWSGWVDFILVLGGLCSGSRYPCGVDQHARSHGARQ